MLTEKLPIEEAIRLAAFEAAPCALLVMDPSGELVCANHAAELLFGQGLSPRRAVSLGLTAPGSPLRNFVERALRRGSGWREREIELVLPGRPPLMVDAVAGLARPEAFFGMLRGAGLQLAQTHALPDHADFADWPSGTLERPLLCTEKDAAKLWQRQPEALAVPLQLAIEPGFWVALGALLAERTGTPVSSAHGQQTA